MTCFTRVYASAVDMPAVVLLRAYWQIKYEGPSAAVAAGPSAVPDLDSAVARSASAVGGLFIHSPV
jgi:hypothetical protein